MNGNRYKYPRTFHLPWSEGVTKDDKITDDLSLFNKEIVVTMKMDGENTTCYSDYIHARSLDSRNHVSRNWVKAFHATFKHNIPIGWRVCGENLFAQHSIRYGNLESYFYLFSIWDDKNNCLNWADTLVFADLLGLKVVPTIYIGKWIDKPAQIHNLFQPYAAQNEGYVVRSVDSFHYNDFHRNVLKFVRKNHVQTDNHWMNQAVIPNSLTETSQS